ncbi:MAG: AAA family ATPase, partial [Actinobacteria bacterium]|nr:AAA family ATPase [Actinomycetota bacterium]
LRETTDYFGLPVVVARRLCDRAQSGQILCTDVVAGLLMGRPDFCFAELGKLDLKGVPRPVSAFAVDYDVPRRPVLAGRMPFVGREPQFRQLQERWRECTAGRGGLVLVAGEPGIGKTRLAEELGEGVEREGGQVLWGHCFEGDWMPPYAAFAEALESLALHAHADELREDLGPSGAALAHLAPALRKTLPDLPEAVALQPPEERFRLLDSLAKLLVARSARGPVLLCLDDLHWADQASIDALRHVARYAPHHRLLLVGTYRDMEAGRDHPLTRILGALRREVDYDRIRLEGLETQAVGELLDRLAAHDIPEEMAAAIAAETNGNPFFIREVLRQLVDEGRIERGPDDRWRSRLSVAELGIPETVREVIGRRLARLSAVANRLLATASAFEGPFHLDIVATAAGLADDEVLDALDEALTAQLLQPGATPDAYAFTHALIRQALYGELSPSRQIRLHRQVAGALEAVTADGPSPAAMGELAAQYHRSRSLPGAERGVEPALSAAGHAEVAGGQAEAARFLRIAVDLIPQGDSRIPRLLGRLGMALIWSLAVDEGFDVAARAGEAIAVAEGPEAAAQYLAQAAAALGAGANNPRAWDLARQGLRHAGERRDATWAQLVVLDHQRREFEAPVNPGIPLDTPERWEAARILRAGNPDPAGFSALEPPFASRGEALAESRNLLTLVCYAGEFAHCAPLASAEAELSLARGQVLRAARCLSAVGLCEVSLGRLEEGRAALEKAKSLLVPAAQPLFATLHGLEMLTAFLDDKEGLERVASDFARLLPKLVPGQAWATGPTYAILARTAARLGRTGEALDFLEQLVPWLEQAPAWAGHFPHMAGYGAETLWLLQRLDHVEVIEQALREKVLAPDFRDVEMDGRLSMARLCTLRGRYAAAAQWFADARRILREQAARPLLAIADYDEALMDLHRAGESDVDHARDLLEAALSQFRAIGMTGWVRQAEERRRLLA